MEVNTCYSPDLLTVRGIDEGARSASFVAATETGVYTWRGKEYLDITGVDLTSRAVSNGVLLDTHDRSTVESIVGSFSARVVGRELIADTSFADTPRGEVAWKLVKGGNLKAVSVGFAYNVSDVADVRENEVYKLGEMEITGPARVIKKWTLIELSLVPIPADPNAVIRRSFEDYKESDSRRNREMDTHNQPTKEATMPDEKKEELRTVSAEEQYEQEEARRVRMIKMRTVPGVEEIAARCIADGTPLEQATKLFSEHLAQKSAPVGTPEASQRSSEPQKPAAKSVSELSAREFKDLLTR